MGLKVYCIHHENIQGFNGRYIVSTRRISTRYWEMAKIISNIFLATLVIDFAIKLLTFSLFLKQRCLSPWPFFLIFYSHLPFEVYCSYMLFMQCAPSNLPHNSSHSIPCGLLINKALKVKLTSNFLYLSHPWNLWFDLI